MTCSKRLRQLGLALATCLALIAPSAARAEKCNPKDPSTCVGTPTGGNCGELGQICCVLYGTECAGNLFCDESTETCQEPAPKPPSVTAFCRDGAMYCDYAVGENTILRLEEDCAHDGGMVTFKSGCWVPAD